mgnify:CR=1 FL=1
MTAVADVMTRGVRSMRPDDNLVQAAQAMEELNVGAIPVCEGERLVGMVTDRDIVVRCVAQKLDPQSCKLSDIMSGHVRTVRENDDVNEVLGEMSSAQIRRMPVVDHQDLIHQPRPARQATQPSRLIPMSTWRPCRPVMRK